MNKIKLFRWCLFWKKIDNWQKNLFLCQGKEGENNYHEIALKIVLAFSLAGFFLASLSQTLFPGLNTSFQEIPLTVSWLTFFLLMLISGMSLYNQPRLATSLLIGVFVSLTVYLLITRGTSSPASLLMAVLVIGLSSVFFNARLAFISAAAVSLIINAITIWDFPKILGIKGYLVNGDIKNHDAILYSALLFIIAAISWLLCRAARQALKRALESERLLREERDSLESKIEARTNELRELEAEKINQLYRLAEFGRLSSGVFHDLINPLTAISLNLEQVRNEISPKVLTAKSYLSQALVATHKMEGLISSIKTQLARERIIKLFSLNEEVKQTLNVLHSKIQKSQINLHFYATHEIKLVGDPIGFGQIVGNLIANAIEACEDKSLREIIVALIDRSVEIEVIVADSGGGIAPQNIDNIFKPFFTTKQSPGHGLGIGLSSSKNIVEKVFHGTIGLKGNPQQVTVFSVKIPREKIETEPEKVL